MIAEKLSFRFDINELVQTFTTVVAHRPPAQGPALHGWSLLSSNGSYLDGWHDGTVHMKSQMTESELLTAGLNSESQKMNQYVMPTEIYQGALKAAIEEIRKLGIEVFRARISGLRPNQQASWHRDAPDHVYRVRLHIPLVTNPNCFFETREGKIHMPADGSSFLIKVNCEHRAYNLGSETRYHIIMDALDRANVSQHHRYSDYLNSQKKIG